MIWGKVKLRQILKQYRVTHIVQNDRNYKQVTISKHDGVKFRGFKNGKEIGRKRQFIIDLKNYPNTLMLVRQGVYDGAIGIAPIEVDGCIATENMPMFSIDGINIDFLKLIIQSPYFKEELEKIPTTGSAQKSIHEKEILEIDIPFPNPEVQNLIVQSFEKNQLEINQISSEITHQLNLVKQLRQAFLREAMQGKLVPQDLNDEPASMLLEKIKGEKERLVKEKKIKKQNPLPPIKENEIPFEIPENWVWCRLGEISINRLGKMLDGIKNKGKELPYLRNLNVQWYSFYLDDIKLMKFEDFELEEYSVKKGDLLIVEGGEPGRCAIWQDDDESFMFQKAIHRVRFLTGINTWIYQYYFDFLSKSNLIYEYFTGAGIKHLTGRSLNKMLLPLPPLSEQQRIVSKLDELMKYCDELEASIKESQLQNEMLLQQVLREALEPSSM